MRFRDRAVVLAGVAAARPSRFRAPTRAEPVVRYDDARVSPGAPTAYLADDGAFVHPITGEADPKLVDRDLAVYALKAGYGVRGASLGSQGDQAALFRDQMAAFFRRTLLA